MDVSFLNWIGPSLYHCPLCIDSVEDNTASFIDIHEKSSNAIQYIPQSVIINIEVNTTIKELVIYCQLSPTCEYIFLCIAESTRKIRIRIKCLLFISTYFQNSQNLPTPTAVLSRLVLSAESDYLTWTASTDTVKPYVCVRREPGKMLT